MDAKDSETPNKAPTVGKEQPCARQYSVNAMSVSGGVSVGFISGGCFSTYEVTTLGTSSNICPFSFK